jgi:hypothetical protein
MPRADPAERLAYERAYRAQQHVRERGNALARARYQANSEKAKARDASRRKDPAYKAWRTEYHKNRRREEWAHVRLAELRNTAEAKGLAFDIDESDLALPEACPVLGIPLVVGSGRQTPNSPSVDRIDNSKGYVKGNVVVVSLRANSLKGSASLAELAKLHAFYAPFTQGFKP